MRSFSRPHGLQPLSRCPLDGLIEALTTKVSAMIMIERDQVEPDTPLVSFGLDSLVSVKLRNWIRRDWY